MMAKHIWIGVTLVALALAIGCWLWLRQRGQRQVTPQAA